MKGMREYRAFGMSLNRVIHRLINNSVHSVEGTRNYSFS